MLWYVWLCNRYKEQLKRAQAYIFCNHVPYFSHKIAHVKLRLSILEGVFNELAEEKGDDW